ncbi:aldose 1-epimerase [Ferruginibacter sp. SUN106]|uniref:aldose 1-epimerase n=1 Tax=Ferruginibacter sp. SUN106 TaxID=2978348 RepID=UPI003D35F58E
MFEVSRITEAGFDKVILKDAATDTRVEIIPSCGAILNTFTVAVNETFINVIDGFENEEDFRVNVAAKGFKSCKLSPFACRINNATYAFGKKDYTIEKFLLNGSALHGLLYDAAFIITATWDNEKSAGVSLQHQYSGSDKGYPFKYTCAVTYELKKDNALTITTTITNNDEGLIPVQDGWHPYFSFGGNIDELQLEFQSKEMVEFDTALIPTGKLLPYQEYGALQKIGAAEFDNCFTVNFAECQPLCVLRDPVNKMQLAIYPDKSYPYLQIYTPPHRKSIAIENLSAVPDAFNNGVGLKVLAPGATESFITTYTITSLP